ncbi:MAG: endonuclease/exonuclease/phosphatase family protein [Niabella sp.]
MISKKRLFPTVAVAVILLLSFNCTAQSYLFASYNLRFDNKNDTGNLWKDRMPAVASLIRYHDFDIFGTQEGLLNQLEDLLRELPEYACYGKGRDDGATRGEHAAVFYKKELFSLLASGDFWLSETPDKPGPGWDATCCNRICSWVYLQDKKSKKRFYFFNVHFDHQGKVARVESSKLMLNKIKEITKGSPAILTGDFNAGRETEPYKIIAGSDLVRDSYKEVQHPYANNSSFNGFGKSLNDYEVIDHIFITSQFKAVKWGILTDTYFGKFPSDHFPVEASVELK